MGNEKFGWMLSAVLLAPVAAAQDAPSAVSPLADTPTEAACPSPRLAPPRYPPNLVRDKLGGTVVLDLGIDACGRVLSVAVKQTSGRPALDAAAADAARGWILTAVDRTKAKDGHVERPITFSLSPDLAIPFAKLDWPRSHKRPRYVFDASSAGFASADAASQAIKVSIEKTIAPPYKGIQSQFFRHGGGEPQEYWLFIHKNFKPNLAARYRLVVENDEPVVQLALVCDDAPEACSKAKDFLLKGLPFAKAR